IILSFCLTLPLVCYSPLFTLPLLDAHPILSLRAAETTLSGAAGHHSPLSQRFAKGKALRPLFCQSPPSSRKRAGDLPTSSRKRRSEEHTSELQSRFDLVCRLLLEKELNNCH